MEAIANNNIVYKGVLTALKTRMHKNRLGELLILDGVISNSQLQQALSVSKSTGRPLGRVLSDSKLVDYSVIRQTLFEQFMLRSLTTMVTLFVSFAGIASMAKAARAASLKDVPARAAFQQAAAYAPIGYYPKIFGSAEKQSRSLNAFTKWTSMFERFDAALNTSSGQQSMETFKAQLNDLRGMPMRQMIDNVNTIVNRVPYINDSQIYGVNDYWATPVEFLKNGGDCEDYAITKYTALRVLGIPEERMRIAIVQDMQKNVPHAILIVYTDEGAVILDNQMKTTVKAERVSHYKPIFSINRDSWWLHTKPAGNGNVTVVASSSK